MYKQTHIIYLSIYLSRYICVYIYIYIYARPSWAAPGPAPRRPPAPRTGSGPPAHRGARKDYDIIYIYICIHT